MDALAFVAAEVGAGDEVAVAGGVVEVELGQVLVETDPPSGQSSQVGAPWVRGLDPRLETNITVLPRSIARDLRTARWPRSTDLL